MDTLEVKETISELSYLTHNYLGYYGKFPSKVGKHILSELLQKGKIDPGKDFVFDSFVGSGTSLVEAKLAGFDSAGVDSNPFAVLASKVKLCNYSISELECIKARLFLYR